jgi:hypothetical protein
VEVAVKSGISMYPGPHGPHEEAAHEEAAHEAAMDADEV